MENVNLLARDMGIRSNGDILSLGKGFIVYAEGLGNFGNTCCSILHAFETNIRQYEREGKSYANVAYQKPSALEFVYSKISGSGIDLGESMKDKLDSSDCLQLDKESGILYALQTKTKALCHPLSGAARFYEENELNNMIERAVSQILEGSQRFVRNGSRQTRDIAQFVRDQVSRNCQIMPS